MIAGFPFPFTGVRNCWVMSHYVEYWYGSLSARALWHSCESIWDTTCKEDLTTPPWNT